MKQPRTYAVWKMAAALVGRHLATAAARPFGTGRSATRSCKNYTSLLKSLGLHSMPPNVALIGVGTGIELASLIIGARRSARRAKMPTPRFLVLHTHEETRRLAELCYVLDPNKAVILPVGQPWAEELATMDGLPHIGRVVVIPAVGRGRVEEGMDALWPLAGVDAAKLTVAAATTPAGVEAMAALRQRGWVGAIEFHIAFMARTGEVRTVGG